MILFSWPTKLQRRTLFGILILLSSILSSAQKHGLGLEFNDAQYLQKPKKALLTRGNYTGLPSKASLKQYCPQPGNQMLLNTSVGWATAYAARTILEAKKKSWTNTREITENGYSPVFNYHFAKVDSEVQNCQTNADLGKALDILTQKGVPRYVDFQEFCPKQIEDAILQKAKEHRLSGYSRIFDINDSISLKIELVKKSLAEGYPVVAGMHIPQSFAFAKDFWQPRETMNPSIPGHAMCVIGYDDSKYGGAFEVINSWGRQYGNDGFMWIRYEDFAEFTRYAFELFLHFNDPDAPDLGGALTLRLNNKKEMIAQLLDQQGYYKILQPYPSGTGFQLLISNIGKLAYVYAFASDLSNAIYPIFPQNSAISPVLNYRSGTVAYPSENKFIQMDDNVGKDFLFILYSKDELPIDNIYNEIKTSFGPILDRVRRVLSDDLILPSNIEFMKNKIHFISKSNERTVVALVIEIDHIK